MVEEEICKELVCLGGIFLAGVGLGQILVLSGKCALTGPGTVALGFFLLFIYLFFQRLAAVVTSVEEKVNFSCSCSYEEGSLSGGHAAAADSSDSEDGEPVKPGGIGDPVPEEDLQACKKREEELVQP